MFQQKSTNNWEFINLKPKSSIYIKFLPENPHALASHKDESVLDVAIRNKVNLDHTCGGSGTCGTCRIFVIEGMQNLPPRNELESEMAEDRQFASNERLACQIPPVDGLTVQIKPDGV